MRRLLPLVAATCLLVPAIGVACLWDYDTLQMERTRFPGTLELITGKFLRHSPEFYRWRIADRLKRLETDPNNLQLLDDLAVAQDKVGEQDQAIATAERTERIQPGRYETAANLGTFLFHSGRLKEGLPHIDRALTINPNAHFGREKYQKLLVEYVLQQRATDPKKLPLAGCTLYPQADPSNLHSRDAKIEGTFTRFLIPPGQREEGLLPEQSEPAIQGVLGMMKFGNYASPVLLEALGSLLSQGDYRNSFDAKNLACRALLKASYEVPDGPARIAYRAMAASSLSMQTNGPDSNHEITLTEVETLFKAELAEAEQWYAVLRERELGWIRDGKNPELEFDKLYDFEPQVGEPTPSIRTTPWLYVGLAGGGLALIAGCFGAARLRRRI